MYYIYTRIRLLTKIIIMESICSASMSYRDVDFIKQMLRNKFKNIKFNDIMENSPNWRGYYTKRLYLFCKDVTIHNQIFNHFKGIASHALLDHTKEF